MAAANAARTEAARDALTAAALDYDGLRAVQELQLLAFNPARLASVNGFHPYDWATRWISQVGILERGQERDGPALALWFYSPNPGRGKTHLAAGLAHDHRREGHSVAFLAARTWMARYWAAPFEERPRMLTHAAERVHLLVVDDLGYGPASPGAVGLWDQLIDARYLAKRWTIFTSQETPDQLAERGMLTDAAWSRVQGMTRGLVLTFDGQDNRLC